MYAALRTSTAAVPGGAAAGVLAGSIGSSSAGLWGTATATRFKTTRDVVISELEIMVSGTFPAGASLGLALGSWSGAAPIPWLASGVVAQSVTSGWARVVLSTPVTLTAGVEYKVITTSGQVAYQNGGGDGVGVITAVNGAVQTAPNGADYTNLWRFYEQGVGADWLLVV